MIKLEDIVKDNNNKEKVEIIIDKIEMSDGTRLYEDKIDLEVGFYKLNEDYSRGSPFNMRVRISKKNRSISYTRISKYLKENIDFIIDVNRFLNNRHSVEYSFIVVPLKDQMFLLKYRIGALNKNRNEDPILCVNTYEEIIRRKIIKERNVINNNIVDDFAYRIGERIELNEANIANYLLLPESQLILDNQLHTYISEYIKALKNKNISKSQDLFNIIYKKSYGRHILANRKFRNKHKYIILGDVVYNEPPFKSYYSEEIIENIKLGSIENTNQFNELIEENVKNYQLYYIDRFNPWKILIREKNNIEFLSYEYKIEDLREFLVNFYDFLMENMIIEKKEIFPLIHLGKQLEGNLFHRIAEIPLNGKSLHETLTNYK